MSLPEILIFRLNKIRGLAMLSRRFCDWEKSKVQVKSGSENLKPIRDGYIIGLSSLARSRWSSQSKKRILEDGSLLENWCARVVLPHCLGPSNATTGLLLICSLMDFISLVLWIYIMLFNHEYSAMATELSWLNNHLRKIWMLWEYEKKLSVNSWNTCLHLIPKFHNTYLSASLLGGNT